MSAPSNHPQLTSALLTGACRFRHAARRQAHEWSKEMSVNCRELAASLGELRGKDRKTALRELGARFGGFLHDTFVLSPIRFIHRRPSYRMVVFMLAGLVPLFGAIVMIAVPAMLFNLPEQRAYFHFGRILQSDAASLIPLLLGILSLVAALRFPLHRDCSDGV